MRRFLPILGIILLFAAPAAADPITLRPPFGVMTVGGNVELLDSPNVQEVLNGQLGLSPKAGDAFVFSLQIRNFEGYQVVGPDVTATFSGRLTLTVGSESFSSDYNGSAGIRHYPPEIGVESMFFFARPNPELPAVTTHGDNPFQAVQSGFSMTFEDPELGLGKGQFTFSPALLSNANIRLFAFDTHVLPLHDPDSGAITNFLWGRPDTVSVSSAPVPEPSTLLLLGTGVAAAGVRRWRQRKT